MSTIALKAPRKSCDDSRCPFHGELSVRGRALSGLVISVKMNKTAIVRRDYLHYISKFRRYERRHSHIPAHSPPCLGIKEGDKVRIAECRPLSKTVAFVIIEKVGAK